MRRFVVTIAVVLLLCSSTVFADESSEVMSFAEFENMISLQTGKTAYEYFGDKAWEAYEYYAENPQCLILQESEELVLNLFK